jgi:hypothetical protein
MQIAGAAAAAPFMPGCRIFTGSKTVRASRDYFCTWETQRALWKKKSSERDNMNEEVLFGDKGWVRELYPDCRSGIMFALDDGWDVPYGARNKGDGYAAFGRVAPDETRFPSLRGSDIERLSGLCRKIEDEGWYGTGVWIAAQAAGETYDRPFTEDRLREDIKLKLEMSQAAGVKYWKVDWGVHSADMWYRRMMSELARTYAPGLIVDHSRGFDNALNGVAHPYDKPRASGERMDITGKTGRMIGNPDFDGVKRIYTELMSFSDSFRTYDTLGPMTSATALERAVFEIACADATNSGCTINVEDEPLIGAALAAGIGIMRSALWPDPVVKEPSPKQRRLAEIARCVAWREYAPVFGSDRGCPVVYSDEVAEENWHYVKKSTWWSEAFDRTLFQRAPSIVARGMKLPKVRLREEERPMVCASRHPDTGALALASLPMLTIARGRHTPACDIELDAELVPSVPFGVFGNIGGTITLPAKCKGRVFARDLLSASAVDITAKTVFEGGKAVLPGAEIAKIGSSASSDPSSPGAVVWLEA